MPALLFQPQNIRDLQLPNRIVVSPMCQYSAQDGEVGDWHLIHLARFAQGGAGTVFVEATAVEARGRITHGDLGIWDDAQVAGLRRIADLVRGLGAVPAIQLAHAGRKACMARPWEGNGALDQRLLGDSRRPWSTIGPVADAVAPGWIVPHAMRREDMNKVKDAFVRAAGRAREAGFGIIELHAAHGYLLHQFLSPLTNHRDDEWGGDLSGRMRWPLEIAAAVREAWPLNRPLFVRISSSDHMEGGWSLDDSVVLARQLAAIGADVIDCSSGGISGSATTAVAAGASASARIPRGPGFQVDYAARIRRDAHVRTMAVGLILDGRQAETILRDGRADLVAIGRGMLDDPNWALHARAAIDEDDPYAHWPQQSGWWLERRRHLLAQLADDDDEG